MVAAQLNRFGTQVVEFVHKNLMGRKAESGKQERLLNHRVCNAHARSAQSTQSTASQKSLNLPCFVCFVVLP